MFGGRLAGRMNIALRHLHRPENAACARAWQTQSPKLLDSNACNPESWDTRGVRLRPGLQFGPS